MSDKSAFTERWISLAGFVFLFDLTKPPVVLLLTFLYSCFSLHVRCSFFPNPVSRRQVVGRFTELHTRCDFGQILLVVDVGWTLIRYLKGLTPFIMFACQCQNLPYETQTEQCESKKTRTNDGSWNMYIYEYICTIKYTMCIFVQHTVSCSRVEIAACSFSYW